MVEFFDVEKRPKRIFFDVGIDLAEDNTLFFEFPFPSHAVRLEEFHEEEFSDLFGFFLGFEEGEGNMIILKKRGIYDAGEGDDSGCLKASEDSDETRIIEIIRPNRMFDGS